MSLFQGNVLLFKTKCYNKKIRGYDNYNPLVNGVKIFFIIFRRVQFLIRESDHHDNFVVVVVVENDLDYYYYYYYVVDVDGKMHRMNYIHHLMNIHIVMMIVVVVGMMI